VAQVGRISGPLLYANLERNGIDIAFRNDLGTTQLLYLDVNSGYIGVNTGTPDKQLEVNGTTQTIDLITGPSRVDGFNISDGKIEAIGNIYLNAPEAVIFTTLDNGTLRINDNVISSTISSADIDITANGTGQVNINTNLNVNADLSATGNITLDGTINFGDASDDSTYPVDTVTFDTEIDSDIIPDQTDTYNLGAPQKRWNELYTNLVNGQAVNATGLTVGSIDFTLRQGNIFFVSQNGTDTNDGDHPQAPVAHIRRALELADASNGGPVVIYVNSGDYEEETPLVVPSNVSIIGAEMRNVNVFPTSYTLSEDVFHLNGETTIQNITVKDFYFDDNKGYAFRYAPNAVISTRSPYIQNVTVITKGTTVTADDPRGFNAGDAGKGAYVDGAELDPASIEASMLFHSCTFITPGVDALTMTNGVRVEWLNSFTYFANRGLYAFNNSTGRILYDGSTIGYGAELRSIGSANVYGNYGAVADGADTLMYLIQHNFGYIGSGKNSENDLGYTNQTNEVVEENSGRIYYVTTDQNGNFRVGDNFTVNFDTGGTSINLSALTADSLNGIIVTSGTDTTIIRGDKIETGNIRISGNDIETLSGDLTIDTPLEINLLDNTNISDNLDITGNLSFDGSLNLLGNQTTDTLKFNVDFDQDFLPNQNLAFSLGTPSKKWLLAHLSRIESGDIRIYDNVIETNVSNADLELRAAGTGNIKVPQNAVFSNALNVSGTSNFNNLNINNGLVFSGDLLLNNSFTTNEFLTASQNLNVGASAQFEEILIDDNFITTTTSNTDLELRASGTGKILISEQDATIQNNLQVQGDTFTSNINNSLQVSAVALTNNTLNITQNVIESTVSNANIELRASGNGIIYIPTTNVQISQDLTVSGNTNLQGTTITGSIVHTGDRTQTGNYTQGGELTVDNIYFEDNFITTTSGDLTLQSSTGRIISVPVNDVTFSQNLTVSTNTDLQGTAITGTLIQVGDTTQTGNITQAGELTVDNVYIEDNFITTTSGNLILNASGTGDVIASTNDVKIAQDLTVSGLTSLQNSVITGTVNHTGNRIQTGNLDIAGEISNSNILIEDNFITTTNTNSNLELRAAGTGRVIVDAADPVTIENNLTVAGTLYYTGSLDISGNVTLTGNTIQDGSLTVSENLDITGWLDVTKSAQFEEILVDDNFITTTSSNADLELRASGSGIVNILGTLNVNNNLTANNLNAGNINIDGDLLLNEIDIPPSIVEINDNYISTKISNADLDLRASGTGIVNLVNSTVIENNLTTGQVFLNDSVTLVGTITQTGNTIHTGNYVGVGSLHVDTLNIGKTTTFENVEIDGNVVQTTLSNSNLDLRAAGSGSIILGKTDINGNLSANDITATNLVIDDGLELEFLQSNTDIKIFDNVITTTNSNSDLELRAAGTGDVTLQNIKINSNLMFTDSLPITFKVNDNLIINSNKALTLPAGASVSSINGDLRFNTDYNLFEGFNGGIVSFGGVYSDDRLTSVTADPTSNTLRFIVGGSVNPLDSTNLISYIDSEALYANELTVEDVSFNNNLIQTTNSNADLQLVSNGTGEFTTGNFSIKDNLLKGNSNPLVIKSTQYGYSKLGTTGATVIPTGNNTTERPVTNPLVGDTRFNTTDSVVEVWDGSFYVAAAGTSSTISESEFNDLLLEYTLIFG